MKEVTWHKIKTVSNLLLAALVLWIGIVAVEYLQELRSCEEKVIDFYNPRKYCDLLCKSGPITPAGRPIEANKSIVLEGVDENLSMIMACQEKTRFSNLSEWIECNRIVRRAPA